MRTFKVLFDEITSDYYGEPIYCIIQNIPRCLIRRVLGNFSYDIPYEEKQKEIQWRVMRELK